MKSSLFKLGIVALGAVSLVACKASVSTDGDGGGTPVQPFSHEVDGPNLDGVWQSECVADGWDNGYVIFNIVIKGQNIARGETKYQDPQCTAQTTTLVRNGLLRYKAKHAGDVYELEYKFEMPNGWYYLGDNISRSGSRMWISDRRVGSGSLPDIALDLVGSVN